MNRPIWRIRRLLATVTVGLTLLAANEYLTVKQVSKLILPDSAPTDVAVDAPSEDEQQGATKALTELLAGPHTIDEAREAALAAVAERQDVLATLAQGVTTHQFLDASTKDLLHTVIGEAQGGLADLAGSITTSSEETAEFRQQLAAISEQHLVFSFIAPQAQALAITATNWYIVTAGRATASQLVTLADTAEQRGRDVAALKEQTVAYQQALDEISTLLIEANANLLSMVPSDPELSRQRRDVAIETLTKASEKIQTLSETLGATIAPLAKAVVS